MRGCSATKVPEPWRRRSRPSSSIALRASRRVARDTWSSAASSGSEGRRVPAGSSPRSIRCLSSSWTETERSRGRAPVARCGLCMLARSIRQTTRPGSRSLTRCIRPLTIRPSSSNVRQLPARGPAACDEQGGCDVAQERRRVGSVRYEEAGEDYFGKRQLRRHAAFWSLWSLGVAAVISGDFYGWNLGLDAGGFGGLLIAMAVITIMYFGLCFSIAEMSPALPHTGGAYSFARSAMGPWGGFITGLAENMEYVITPAVVVGAMGFLMHDIVTGLFNIAGGPWWNSPVTWWAVFYVVFVWINIIGIEATMRFTVVINILALGILGFFFISVLFSGKLDTSLWTNTPPEEGGSSFLPKGIAGIFPAIPFASFFTIIYAYGRNTFSLSRAGSFPKWLSVTPGTRNTPHRALIAGAVVGYALAVLLYQLGKSEGALAGQIVGALLYMAVFGAVISYFMQCLSFILLRRKYPNIERPYRSPVGEWGAAIAGVIAVVSLISLYSNEDYRPGVWGTLIYFVLGIAYFAISGRNRLVLSPEEEFAMTRGEHGRPQQEGYGTTHVADIGAEPTVKETPAP